MAIQDRRFSRDNPYARKANQAWEMAGLARQDGDRADEAKQTAEARRLEALAAEHERAKKERP